jgi:hypothetical protein
MPKRTSIPLALVLSSALAAATPPTPVTLVVCAPGYPGTTAEAQPSMDVLADAVSRSVGWPVGTVTAQYQETEEGGLALYRSTRPTLALVPLAFYLAHGRELTLNAKAQVVPKDGKETDVFTLVAKKGRVASASSLDGWRLVSLVAYAPDFIRNVALARWGKLPKDVTFVASGQILSSLKRASAGEDVAVLLDGTQTASLPSLPFAGDLEAVAASAPVPAFVLCSVGPSLGPVDSKRLIAGLLKLHQTPSGAAALEGVRMSRFVPADDKALAALRKAYAPNPLAPVK